MKSPDLVFLDIEMPEMSGFELLQQLPEIDFEVVFITAYAKYAVQAFRFAALDYLMKPLDIEDLEQCIQRVQERMSNRERPSWLGQFVREITTQQDREKRIPIPTAEKLFFEPVGSIVRCEGQVNYTAIHLVSGERILVSKTLKEYDTLLREYNFIRVHQSHLVNRDHIRKFVKSDGGYLILSDGSQVSVARNRKERIVSTLLEF